MDSDVVVAIETAVILGRDWPPPGVPDTAETRAMRDRISTETAALDAAGIMPDVPSEWPAP